MYNQNGGVPTPKDLSNSKSKRTQSNGMFDPPIEKEDNVLGYIPGFSAGEDY